MAVRAPFRSLVPRFRRHSQIFVLEVRFSAYRLEAEVKRKVFRGGGHSCLLDGAAVMLSHALGATNMPSPFISSRLGSPGLVSSMALL